MEKLKRCNLQSAFKPIDENSAIKLADFYKMFADPGRIKILYLLMDREICVNHIAAVLDMTVSAVSHQLRLLRTQDLVRFIREGKNIYYALDDNHVQSMLKVAKEHLQHSN